MINVMIPMLIRKLDNLDNLLLTHTRTHRYVAGGKVGKEVSRLSRLSSELFDHNGGVRTMTDKTIVGVGQRGRRTGQYSGTAKLSDHEVNLIRDLYENDRPSWSMSKLAKAFDVKKSTIQGILDYSRRVSHVTGYKTVRTHNKPV